MAEIGDRVRVVADVWDDHRNSSWLGWEGVVKSTSPVDVSGYDVYVFFPKSRGTFRFYDFAPNELEVIS